MSTGEALAASWRTASADLGINVEAVPTAVLVTGFGSPAVCETKEQAEQLRRDAEQRGAFCSVLSDSYLTYDRHLFVGTLDDWGWFGDGPPPHWYTGAAWGA